MIWLRQFASRFAALFRKGCLEQEMNEELRAHLEMLIEENVRHGMSSEEARYAALREFGDVDQTKEVYREQRGLPIMETLLQDIRFGLRQLRRNPGFTIVTVLTLALGIGANTTIFSAVYGIVFRSLPYRDPNRLVAVWTQRIKDPGRRSNVSLPDFKDWESQNSVFEGLAAYGYDRYNIPDLEGGEGLRAAQVTPGFFPLLGVNPFLGRESGPADDRERVVVLSYELWQRLFHGDRSIVGRSIRLREHDYSVIGIMPPSFRLPTPDIDMWVTFADIYASSGSPSVGNWLTDRGLHGYRVLARLKEGVSLTQAQTQMDLIQQRLADSFPEQDKGFSVILVPMRTQIIGNVESAMLLLLGGVGFILLIACVNVANLMLSRATLRERETAVRRALGAGAGRLARQILTESALLGAIGGGLGIILAFGGLEIFLGLSPQSIPRLQDVRVDGPVLLFAVGATLLAILLFGLAPAFRVLGPRLNDTLREGGRGVEGHTRGRHIRGFLIVCEIALATVLVTGAGLMLNSFMRLAMVNPGFQPDHLLTFDVGAPLSRYRLPQQQSDFFNQILARVRALPGVKAAGACTSMPPDSVQEADTFTIQGRTPADDTRSPEAWYLPSTPGFMEALGLPLIKGREFSDADGTDGPPVAIVNQEVAKRYFEHDNPLGQKIDFRGVQRTIVGVVGNTKYYGLGSPPGFQIYVPYAQGTFPGLHLAIRTTGDPLLQVSALRAAIHSVDSEARPTRIATMDDLISRSIIQPRFYAWLLGAFGLVALVLAAIGIFGVISYSVSQRTREIGIRMALGAERKDMLMLVVGQGFKLTLIGVVIGIIGAFALTRFLASLLYDVKPTDPATFIAVSLLLSAVALLASYIPARRATKVDPMVALRYE